MQENNEAPNIIKFPEKRDKPLSSVVTILSRMLSINPILANVLGITLGACLLAIAYHPFLLPKLGKYYNVLIYCLKALIALQLIKSAAKSCILPLIAMGFAGVGWLVDGNFFLFLCGHEILQETMLLGIMGCAVAVFYIR